MDHDMSFIISNKKIVLPKTIKIILILLCLFVIFILNYKISIYDIYEAKVVKGDDYYVQVLVDVNKQDFLSNDEVLIENKKYNYEILNIENDYIYDLNKKYMIVNVSIKLDKKYKVNNNYLILKQKRKKETIFNLILEKFKKGMYI